MTEHPPTRPPERPHAEPEDMPDRPAREGFDREQDAGRPSPFEPAPDVKPVEEKGPENP